MPLTRAEVCGVHSSVTVISLQVRVPVLSEQITVVEPSVSTAGSLRMMALRRAMRCTPMARAMVTTAGRPSGMAPTARAMAKMRVSLRAGARAMPWPRARYTPTVRMTTDTAITPNVMYLPISPSFLVSGVSRSTALSSMSEMRPSSVRMPVPTTAAVAVPEVTRVPL